MRKAILGAQNTRGLTTHLLYSIAFQALSKINLYLNTPGRKGTMAKDYYLSESIGKMKA